MNLRGTITAFGVLTVLALLHEGYFSSEGTTSTSAGSSNASVAGVISELGCGTKYSDEKAEHIFNANYKNQWMTTRGVIETNDNGTLGLKILPHTFTFDLQVKLSDKSQGYHMRKGETVTVQFVMRRAGGCFTYFDGDNGRII